MLYLLHFYTNFIKLINMYHQLYNPRYPPPQINSYPSQDFNIQSLEQSNDDHVWLNTWVSKISNVNQIQNTSISFTRSKINEIHVIIKQLQKLQIYLKKNVKSLTSKKWNDKIQLVTDLKMQLKNYFSMFDSIDSLKAIQKRICKRKKKRLIEQRKRKAAQEKKQMSLKNRADKHKSIDAKVLGMRKIIEENRQMEMRIRDAEAVLSNVKSRISEANRWLSIIDGLQALRSARDTAATGRGESADPSHNKTFCKIMDELSNMWKSRLQKYCKEELELKSSLDKKELSLQGKDTTVLQQWETVLWGQIGVDADNAFKCTPADKNMQEFIEIRCKWDRFIVPESNELGTKLPIGWVLPENRPDWEKYLAEK